MNIVVIPCFRRPAMLAALLRSIEACEFACYQRYLFAIDREAYKHVDEVIDTFSCTNKSVVRRRHRFPGHTFNVLEGIKSARDQLRPTDLVYVLHEDMIVSPDFFNFHVEAHKLDPHAVFVSSARGGRVFFGKDIESMVYRAPLASMRAVSFQAYRLERVIDHAQRAYYRDMIGYCASYLSSTHPVADAEVEGLVRRVAQRSTDGYGLHPVIPRASHIGYVGTNHGGLGSIEQLDPMDWKADCERLLSMTDDQLQEKVGGRYRDIDRAPLITESQPLRLV
jgi:hypothetical protein